MFLTSFPLSRTRGQMREVPIRVESDSTGVSRESVGINRSPEERIIPTNATHAEHRDFGIFSFSNLPFICFFAGFPIRLDKRPLGPRDTPQFAKKQEYL